MAKQGIIITHDDIGPTLDRLIGQGAGKVVSRLQKGAELVQNTARRNAPWSDITGQARDGLTARVYEEGDDAVLELSHSVAYGKWLETIQNGQYAIILPTLESLGQQIFRDAGQGITEGGDFY